MEAHVTDLDNTIRTENMAPQSSELSLTATKEAYKYTGPSAQGETTT